MTDIRETGIAMLGTVVKKLNNVKLFEDAIYSKVGNDEDTYLWCVYQVVGQLLLGAKEKNRMKEILDSVRENKIGWRDDTYAKIAERIEEFDNYLIHPFDVVDGVVECGKCGSNKTWSVQKQTRSSDEPMTTFSRCAKCGHSWTYSG